MFDPDIEAHYSQGVEAERLAEGLGPLELVRTQELVRRYLPSAPANVLDVGGAVGVYAAWLARDGYRVHLVDPVPLHVERAKQRAADQADHPFTAAIGDARRLAERDESYDAVLLFGPLYHLVERSERLTALREARRVLRRGGVAFAVGISRYASLLDGLRSGWLDDLAFRRMVQQDLRDGQHRNPEPEQRPEWFTTAFFHQPDELAEEVTAAGFRLEGLFGIQGPGWLLGAQWTDAGQREQILYAARAAEQERSLLGVSSHMLAVGTA
jgi:ubiquinone/menaquinone biosynthesis C-methylase UbiE